MSMPSLVKADNTLTEWTGIVKDNPLAGTIEMYGGNSNYKDRGIRWLLLSIIEI